MVVGDIILWVFNFPNKLISFCKDIRINLRQVFCIHDYRERQYQNGNLNVKEKFCVKCARAKHTDVTDTLFDSNRVTPPIKKF